jgi:superfamily I DNA/RNA helicase
MVWLVGENRLTTDQLRAVEALPTESRLIVGGPGSGKTLVLLHRARYLSDRYRVPAERFRIIVYTNVLRDYIQSACHELGVPLDNVLTFDHWCRLYYERHIGRRIPWNHQAKRPDFEHMCKAVAGHVATLRPQLYDFVLVDEGQDLEVEAFAVLRTISKHSPSQPTGSSRSTRMVRRRTRSPPRWACLDAT